MIARASGCVTCRWIHSGCGRGGSESQLFFHGIGQAMEQIDNERHARLQSLHAFVHALHSLVHPVHPGCECVQALPQSNVLLSQRDLAFNQLIHQLPGFFPAIGFGLPFHG